MHFPFLPVPLPRLDISSLPLWGTVQGLYFVMFPNSSLALYTNTSCQPPYLLIVWCLTWYSYIYCLSLVIPRFCTRFLFPGPAPPHPGEPYVARPPPHWFSSVFSSKQASVLFSLSTEPTYNVEYGPQESYLRPVIPLSVWWSSSSHPHAGATTLVSPCRLSAYCCCPKRPWPMDFRTTLLSVWDSWFYNLIPTRESKGKETQICPPVYKIITPKVLACHRKQVNLVLYGKVMTKRVIKTYLRGCLTITYNAMLHHRRPLTLEQGNATPADSTK